MRIYTKGKEFVFPAVTRFATNFISLQSMVEQKVNLNRMLLGPEWMASKHGKTLEGIEIVALVFNDGFWKDDEEIISMTGSLVKVLRYSILKFFQCSPVQLQSQTSFHFQISFKLYIKNQMFDN